METSKPWTLSTNRVSIRRHLRGKKIGDGVEVGAVLEKKAGRLVIAGGGGAEHQAAGVLVESQHHDGRFVRGRMDAALHEQVGQDGDRGPDRLNDLDIALEIPLTTGMMVIDMNLDARL